MGASMVVIPQSYGRFRNGVHNRPISIETEPEKARFWQMQPKPKGFDQKSYPNPSDLDWRFGGPEAQKPLDLIMTANIDPPDPMRAIY
jgi:hypothetical protein